MENQYTLNFPLFYMKPISSASLQTFQRALSVAGLEVHNF